MKTVFLYAGQGSQRENMGMDIYEKYEEYRDVIDSLELEFDIKSMMHGGNIEELSRTKYTQPCMAAFAAGVTNVLKSNGIIPDAACGLSLGEYGALYAAGIMSHKDYVETVAYRGKVMDEASVNNKCCMSAILGLDSDTVEEACNKCSEYGYVTLVNYNCPGQYVISGDENAVEKTEEMLKSLGAKRCVRLKVSGPFHTKYMEEASVKLRDYLEKVEFNKPSIPLVLNVTGDFYEEKSNLKDILKEQVKSGVRFEASICRLLDKGATRFIEIGPGNALSSFVKKIAKAQGKDVEILNIDTLENIESVIGGDKSGK